MWSHQDAHEHVTTTQQFRADRIQKLTVPQCLSCHLADTMPLEAAQRIDCLKDSHNPLRPEVVPSSISKALASGCSIDHCTADALSLHLMHLEGGTRGRASMTLSHTSRISVEYLVLINAGHTFLLVQVPITEPRTSLISQA
jgi:hypothetical protein